MKRLLAACIIVSVSQAIAADGLIESCAPCNGPNEPIGAPRQELWIAGGTTTAVVVPLPCSIAIITFDKNVSIDWTCVERAAEDWGNGKGDATIGATAWVLKAIHDGTAKDAR